ncbi:5-beta-cholestane-3-alpha,7-alpha-diol 12-alpha-hydroxylase [Stegostoma tigrinum]|uniref:5-beta-cholestane-3-alpha,7-alpha-diol 12-alpha-hydroxylase n=1 Tax=Stegostoma tigrinum TaxID=3053191 RepID=UPI0028707D13|nr:5-beta-cholestane-3-alpha,7-alpha-diol 12-alpha-hydroxylase [Stegostoma tigrinum]
MHQLILKQRNPSQSSWLPRSANNRGLAWARTHCSSTAQSQQRSADTVTTRDMAVLLPVLLCLGALLLALLYWVGAFRRRRPGEPPFDRGWLPWLGHVLSFRRDTAEFLRRMQGKHGDIFTVQLAGDYVTFLMEPHSFGAVVKESRAKLDFEKFATELVARVFGYHARENDHQLLEALSHKYLMGDGLEELTQAMTLNLQNLMLEGLPEGEWMEDGLFHFCYNMVFRAGYLSLFGNEQGPGGDKGAGRLVDRQHSETLFTEFRRYDRLFPRLAYAVLLPGQKVEAERLKRYFWETLSVDKMRHRENISGWVSERQRQMEEQGLEKGMRNRYMLLLLWASQGNTGPSAFWLLLHLARHPEALQAVRAEADNMLRESGQEAGPGKPPVRLTRRMLQQCPVLDSAVEESMRLAAAPVLIRAVLQDMALRLHDGREYRLRRGDRLALFPHLSLQMDPEIYPEPTEFRYDRFLQPSGLRKTDFYKGGRRLKYFTMPWGAGVSICPGRFFAVNELKQFIFLMLIYFDFELLQPEDAVPPIDRSRWGFGVMQPCHEVRFRYRQRS